MELMGKLLKLDSDGNYSSEIDREIQQNEFIGKLFRLN